MIKLVSDENFVKKIIQNLHQQLPGVDIVRVQDVGLRTLDDPAILEWAANNNRILLTHDIATMPDFAYARIYKGLLMPGVFVVPENSSTAEVVESLLLILRASEETDWNNQVTFLPL